MELGETDDAAGELVDGCRCEQFDVCLSDVRTGAESKMDRERERERVGQIQYRVILSSSTGLNHARHAPKVERIDIAVARVDHPITLHIDTHRTGTAVVEPNQSYIDP